MRTDTYKFKKGEVRHLDSFFKVAAYAQQDHLLKAVKLPHESDCYFDESTAENYEVLQSFEITVTVKITKATNAH